jgi:hypothetical protein
MRCSTRAGALAVTTHAHFTYRVDTWTTDGESIVEHVAGTRLRLPPTNSRLQQISHLPYPSGASSVLLRGRAERISATRLQRKRVSQTALVA